MINKSIESEFNPADFRVADFEAIDKQYEESVKSGVLDPEKVEARKKSLEAEHEARKLRLKETFEIAGEFAKNS